MALTVEQTVSASTKETIPKHDSVKGLLKSCDIELQDVRDLLEQEGRDVPLLQLGERGESVAETLNKMKLDAFKLDRALAKQRRRSFFLPNIFMSRTKVTRIKTNIEKLKSAATTFSEQRSTYTPSPHRTPPQSGLESLVTQERVSYELRPTVRSSSSEAISSFSAEATPSKSVEPGRHVSFDPLLPLQRTRRVSSRVEEDIRQENTISGRERETAPLPTQISSLHIQDSSRPDTCPAADASCHSPQYQQKNTENVSGWTTETNLPSTLLPYYPSNPANVPVCLGDDCECGLDQSTQIISQRAIMNLMKLARPLKELTEEHGKGCAVIALKSVDPYTRGSSCNILRGVLHIPAQPVREVAVKQFIVEPEVGLCETVMNRRAFREAVIWSRLEHTNISPCLGLWMADGLSKIPMIASPWAEHSNLKDYLLKQSTETSAWQQRLPKLVNDVIEGMNYLHHPNNLEDGSGVEGGFFHGDLHMQNILVFPANSPGSDVVLRITDFGLSGSMSPNPGLQATQSTSRVYFLAPELSSSQLKEEGEEGEEEQDVIENLPETVQLKQSADMYALGIVICWMMARTYPFDVRLDNFNTFLEKSITDHEEFNRHLKIKVPHVHENLFRLLRGCWEIKHQERLKIRDFRSKYQGLTEDARCWQL